MYQQRLHVVIKLIVFHRYRSKMLVLPSLDLSQKLSTVSVTRSRLELSVRATQLHLFTSQLAKLLLTAPSAIKAGVPVVPGTAGAIESYDLADSFIKEVGFPVIIKAAMGGGGRGMRVVRDQESFQDSFQRAVSEAKSAFGDGTVFIERFLDKPRHIEVQLLGDSHGNVVHLFERDCSVQRRHQKVVEQAPAVLDDDVRFRILEDAKKIAKAVNYRNAGTVSLVGDFVKHDPAERKLIVLI